MLFYDTVAYFLLSSEGFSYLQGSGSGLEPDQDNVTNLTDVCLMNLSCSELIPQCIMCDSTQTASMGWRQTSHAHQGRQLSVRYVFEFCFVFFISSPNSSSLSFPLSSPSSHSLLIPHLLPSLSFPLSSPSSPSLLIPHLLPSLSFPPSSHSSPSLLIPHPPPSLSHSQGQSHIHSQFHLQILLPVTRRYEML